MNQCTATDCTNERYTVTNAKTGKKTSYRLCKSHRNEARAAARKAKANPAPMAVTGTNASDMAAKVVDLFAQIQAVYNDPTLNNEARFQINALVGRMLRSGGDLITYTDETGQPVTPLEPFSTTVARDRRNMVADLRRDGLDNPTIASLIGVTVSAIENL